MMRIKIPFIGFIDKTIHTDFIQAILRVFRETQDKHRVMIMVPLTLLVSHSYYLSRQPHIAVILTQISNSEGIWIILASFVALFVFGWGILSSPFSPALYARQAIFIIWTGLLHRLSYGLETLGTPYFNVISFCALTYGLPFAFTGKGIPYLFTKAIEDYKMKKESLPMVEIPKMELKADAA